MGLFIPIGYMRIHRIGKSWENINDQETKNHFWYLIWSSMCISVYWRHAHHHMSHETVTEMVKCNIYRKNRLFLMVKLQNYIDPMIFDYIFDRLCHRYSTIMSRIRRDWMQTDALLLNWIPLENFSWSFWSMVAIPSGYPWGLETLACSLPILVPRSEIQLLLHKWIRGIPQLW